MNTKRKRNAKRKNKGPIINSMGVPIGKPKLKPRVEVKWTDTVNANQSAPAEGNLAQVILNDQTQGTSAVTRVGVQCSFYELNMTYTVYNQGTSGIDQVMRVLVVADMQSDAAQFAAAALFSYSQYQVSEFQPAYQARFKVLYDRIHTLNYYGNSAQSVKLRKRINVRAFYNSTNGGTYADIDTGTIWLCYCTDVATNEPTITYSFRLYFSDD